MDEIIKALGPFPALQVVFGAIVLGLGVYSVIRGLYGKEGAKIEDQRSRWEAYGQLERIDRTAEQLLQEMRTNNELTKQLIDTVNRWGAFFFNKTQV